MALGLYQGLKQGGVTFVSFLPDSVLYDTEQHLLADDEIRTVVCSREDEGVAVAAGAALAGETAAVLMEGSGMGLCGLIFARAMSQRTPLLVIFSHVRSRGDRFDYHQSSRIAGEGTCVGLGIPYETASDDAALPALVADLLATAQGQKTIVGLGIPGSMRV